MNEKVPFCIRIDSKLRKIISEYCCITCTTQPELISILVADRLGLKLDKNNNIDPDSITDEWKIRIIDAKIKKLQEEKKELVS